VSHAVAALAHAAGGSISVEHGIGVTKRDDLKTYKSPVELELMWQIKRAQYEEPAQSGPGAAVTWTPSASGCLIIVN
jgi:hypothetical protein